MSSLNQTEPIPNGTIVKIHNSGFGRGEVVEYRGPLGPKGARVYRVCVRKKPHHTYTEVLEEQLEVIAPEGQSVPPEAQSGIQATNP